MPNMFAARLCASALALVVSGPAYSHSTLEQKETRTGTFYRAVVQITHGCGDSPTTSVSITVPEGAIGARPMAKPGWTITTTHGPYARSSALRRLLMDKDASPTLDAKAGAPPDDDLSLDVPARLSRVGRGVRLLVDPTAAARTPDPSLLRMLARAHETKARLVETPALSVHDLAREQDLSAAHLYMVLRLAFLAPDVVTAIVEGRQPAQLSAKTLMRRAAHLPADWSEQRRLLGFA